SNEVRDRVDSILASLPEGVEKPSVQKIDPDATPILTLAVTSTASVRDVTEYADKGVKRQLESISGVGEVTIIGGRARQINVWINPDELRKYALTATDVERTLRSQNVEVPSGRVEQGSKVYTVRTRGRVASVGELGEVIVGVKDGYAVKL